MNDDDMYEVDYGAMPGSGGIAEERPIDTLLLELIAHVATLEILLAEATDEEVVRVRKRLAYFKISVEELPEQCMNPRRKVGFVSRRRK